MVRAGDRPGVERLGLFDVGVSYGSTDAVRGVSLSVAEGEVVAVVGPSGSGKSTLLRAIAGLEPLTVGRIEIDGRDAAGVPSHRRGVGLMFQDNALFPHLDVGDNVAYGLKMAGWSRQRSSLRVRELLGLVGLDGYDARPVGSLSGGEAQRVALARALAPEPSILLLDEPFGALDRSLREHLTGEVAALLDQLGQTAVHVTHDQGEAFTLGRRVAVLIDGAVARIGAPAEVWGDPQTERVARFIGHNTIVSLVADGGELWLGATRLGSVPGFWPVKTGPVSAAVPATAVTVGPYLAESEGHAGPVLQAEVSTCRFDHGRWVIAAVGGDNCFTAFHREPMDRGERVGLSLRVEGLLPLN